MNNGVANDVVRCARDRVAGRLGGGGQGMGEEAKS